MSNSISVVYLIMFCCFGNNTDTVSHEPNRKKTITIERTNEENQEIKKTGGLCCDKILRSDFVRSVS